MRGSSLTLSADLRAFLLFVLCELLLVSSIDATESDENEPFDDELDTSVVFTSDA